ncbi:hypothetical protein GGI00_005835 [Coemansia sp. RSA 2681]|nr:hypothetical protein GGI00_005835 [Coemansia sp. RSA 2681]
MSNPANNAENAEEDSAPHTPEAAELVQGLASTAQTMSTSLLNMQQALLGNMQQAAQMTMSMNMMMEELVKRAVQVGVHAERLSLLPDTAAIATGGQPRYRCALRVAVRNKSPIPLLKMTASLWFSRRVPPLSSVAPKTGTPAHSGTRDQADECQLEISQLGKSANEMLAASEDSDTVQMALGKAKGVLPDSIDTSALPFAQATLGSSTHLPSSAEAGALLVLSVSALEQLNGAIAVEFASPGTGGTLSVSHRFGIRLLHLVDCRFVACSSVSQTLLTRRLRQMPNVSAIAVDILHIRKMFAVPPADGIAPGALLLICMPRADCAIGLQIASISPDLQSATCTWMTSPLIDAQGLLSLVPLLEEELAARSS